MKPMKKAYPRSTSTTERRPERLWNDRGGVMAPEARPCQSHPVRQVAEAHHLLKLLRERVGDHPELEEALTKLEIALSALTVNSGGLL
jgi:hypothetical protein